MSDGGRSPRILITRLSAIGDCILTMPVASALRAHYPDAHIVWAVEPLAADLIERHVAVDAIVRVPKRWLQSMATVRRLRQELRAARFDLAIDPQSLTKSSMLSWLSGARRRIGFARPQGRELAPWLNTERVARQGAHLVDASLYLLAPLGMDHPSVRFDVPRHCPAENRVNGFVREALLTGGFAVINSAASWRSKQWPADRFGRVARFLGEEYQLPVVVTWAGDGEQNRARRIIAKSGGHALQAPSTTLLELAALMRRARLVIGSDTGPLHLAAAVGTACVGLHGPTRAERSGPYGPGHVTLQADFPHIRNRRRRRQDDSAMRSISVESVCGACEQVLATPQRHDSASHAA